MFLFCQCFPSLRRLRRANCHVFFSWGLFNGGCATDHLVDMLAATMSCLFSVSVSLVVRPIRRANGNWCGTLSDDNLRGRVRICSRMSSRIANILREHMEIIRRTKSSPIPPTTRICCRRRYVSMDNLALQSVFVFFVKCSHEN